MRRLQLWIAHRRVAFWTTVLVALVLAGMALTGVVLGAQVVRDAAPVAAASVALLSLVVAAASALGNWQRQKREATIKAWTDWSDSTRELRAQVTAVLGEGAITKDQARGLVDQERPLLDKDGRKLRAAARREIRITVASLLNGLERLAAGANLGVFDGRTLKALGGTIIVRHCERFEEYIKVRRSGADGQLTPHVTAFVELEWFVSGLQSRRFLDMGRKLDEQRLRHLRNR
ncbi:UNVERIFIED_ORG: hypothetical protein E4P37_01545 [Bacillus sp. AZ43]